MSGDELERISEAMRRRRNRLVDDIAGLDHPPAWARTLVGNDWTSPPARAGSQQELVGRIAVYRDRYGIAGHGLDPFDHAQRTVWIQLRYALHGGAASDDSLPEQRNRSRWR